MEYIVNSLAEDILSAVDAAFDEQLAFTQEVVSFNTERGQELDGQAFIFEALDKRCYTMDRWAIDIAKIKYHPGFSPVTVDYSNAINVVGTHEPRVAKGRSLILNGHIDVVPAGPWDMWSRLPYDPTVEGDWLYGRGSGDMKAGLVANIFALDALRAIGYQPAARVHIQSVTEEECTGNGALSCLQRGYRADAAIIPEPTNNSLVRANVGVIWFRVHVRGKPVHVAYAESGANAIEAAIPLMQALRHLEARWNAQKYKHVLFKDHDHPISLNIGKIEGGDWASSVPAWCSFDCRIAIFPGTDPADAAQEIKACIEEAALTNEFLTQHLPEVEFNGFYAKGYELEEGTEAEATLAKAHAHVAGMDLQSDIMAAYLDARVFMLYDNCPCLVYGPIAENIHGFDERVSLSSLKKVTAAIALFVAEWCGLEFI